MAIGSPLLFLLDGSDSGIHHLIILVVRVDTLELIELRGGLGSTLGDTARLDSYITSLCERKRRQGEESTPTVWSRGTALLGSSSALLASSSTLLHVHVHASSSFGLGNENLGCLLVNTSAVLDGIVGFVEVTGNSLTVDLCEGG
jgi:hypothetical protein